MKAHITSAGFLELERNGKMKPQICPMNSNRHMCGDYCPLFGEAKPTMDIGLYGRSENTGQTTIEICHRDLIFDELTDDRPKRKEVV